MICGLMLCGFFWLVLSLTCFDCLLLSVMMFLLICLLVCLWLDLI